MTELGIPQAIRSLLACPKCHASLEDDVAGKRLKCMRCLLAYSVRDGIPVMLIDEASRVVPE